MRDFDYDVWQKKILARSAAHKKNGSKSKKCTLPSDHLTEAQKRQLNGKVYTMNRNKPMTWEAFTALPQSLAQEYIRFLQEQYDVRVGNIAQMFEVNRTTFKNYCEKQGIAYTSKAGHLMAEKKQAWEAFLGVAAEEPATDPVVEETPEPEEKAEHVEPKCHPVEVERLTIDVTGDLLDLAEYLKTLPFHGRCRMVVTLEKVEGLL